MNSPKKLRSETTVEKMEHVTVTKEPIIREKIHKKIIEEIQPIIMKEIIAPHIIREVLPVYEKIVEAPTLTKEVLPEKNLGVSMGQENQEVERIVLASKPQI